MNKMEKKKIKRIELTDDANHIGELLVRIRKSGKGFHVYRNGKFIKEYNPKSDNDWKRIYEELESEF